LLALKYGRYVFTCIFEDDAALPSYKGSTLRGVFGHALKKVVYALKKQECSDCLLAERCIYPAIFETPRATNLSSSGRKRIASAPHPYVIEPPEDHKTMYKRGDRLEFVILLFGKANECLPYFIYAFDQMGQMGIGKRINGKGALFYLEEVAANESVVYSKRVGKILNELPLSDLSVAAGLSDHDAEMDITITLITPLRLKYQNSLNADLPFHVLIRAMLRRASSLLAHHDSQEPELDFCEKVHIGKATTFGLGKIHVQGVS
jgi:hypothetical protein